MMVLGRNMFLDAGIRSIVAAVFGVSDSLILAESFFVLHFWWECRLCVVKGLDDTPIRAKRHGGGFWSSCDV